MFNNIGSKIKTLAKVLCGIGICVSIIIGGFVMASGNSTYYGYRYYNRAMGWAGAGIIILGSLFSWIGSFFIYGFGELIENSAESKKLLQKLNGIEIESEEVKDNEAAESEKTENENTDSSSENAVSEIN